MDSIRVPEWGQVSVGLTLDQQQRERLAELATAWKEANRLPQAPIAFGGIKGDVLATRQYVGVIEADGVCIEIYPKLDKGAQGQRTNLLWMLEVSGYENLVETGTGGLEESFSNFPDLFALLMARRLREELARGVPRSYERVEDDLKTVRGRLLLGQQATRNFNRWDRLACAFDEFTPDTTVCRILRCACQTLLGRVQHPEALRLLSDCVGLLDDVSEISLVEALHAANLLPPWSRALERFRRPYELAVRLLRGFSHELQAGSTDTFVFLLDMNQVFEAYAAAALEARFGTQVQTQEPLGKLLPYVAVGGIYQYADFYWTASDGTVWIGDAKYKHLAAGQQDSLTFAKDETAPAGRLLSPDDIRQLTVYAELDKRKRNAGTSASLALIYPFVGEGKFKLDTVEAWNGSKITLLPLRVVRQANLAEALPAING